MVHCMSVTVMDELLSMFSQTNFIWAHAEMCFNEPLVLPMLDRHANLYCDIGVEFRFESKKLFCKELSQDDEWLPQSFAAWQTAALQHPSRIMWGTDIFTWSDLDPANYKRSREVWKLFCAQLPAEAISGIGGENLLSLLPE